MSRFWQSLILFTFVYHVHLQTVDLEAVRKVIADAIAACQNNVTITKAQLKSLVVDRQKPKTEDEACFMTCIFKTVKVYDPKNDSVIAERYRVLINVKKDTDPEYKKKMEVVDYCESHVNFDQPDECQNINSWVSCIVDTKERLNVITGLW